MCVRDRRRSESARSLRTVSHRARPQQRALLLLSTEVRWWQAFYLLALVSIASLLPAIKEEHRWTDRDMFAITSMTTFGTASQHAHVDDGAGANDTVWLVQAKLQEKWLGEAGR